MPAKLNSITSLIGKMFLFFSVFLYCFRLCVQCRCVGYFIFVLTLFPACDNREKLRKYFFPKNNYLKIKNVIR